MKLKPLTLDIRNCLRCGKNHFGMVFTPFKRETCMEFKWWATCPKTKEPLMVSQSLLTDARLALMRAHGHSAEPAGWTNAVRNLVNRPLKAKRRCPKCRRGPIIVKTYANEDVECHCVDCGNTWQPRRKT